MKAILDLFILTCIVVFIVDISGFVDNFKSCLKKILTHGLLTNSDYRLKPFDCSLCMTWWTGIIYLLCTGNFTIPMIGVVALFAFLTITIKNYIYIIEGILQKIPQILQKLLEKL